MISRVKKNDKVVTAGGVHGTITSLRENEIILRIDDAKDVKVKLDRSAIAAVLEVSHEETEENTKEGKETK